MNWWGPIATAVLTVAIMFALRALGIFPRRQIPSPAETLRKTLPPGAVPENRSEAKWRSLLGNLRDLGFFDQVPEAEIEEAIHRCLEARWMFDDAVRRTAFADVEHLAEGGFIDWLTNEGAELLAFRGVTMPDVRQTLDDDRYVVHVGSNDHVVYEAGNSPDTQWVLAAEACVRIVNHQLTAAGAQDRLYWLHGAEDGVVGLMTPAMFEAITRARVLNSSSWPYAA
jgi:hypothetical protein